MGRISISNNVKTYFISKPPTLVFVICLISFILILAYFIVFVKTHQVHNPDELDWNIFREKMASLDYCVKYQSQVKNNKTKNQQIDGKKYFKIEFFKNFYVSKSFRIQKKFLLLRVDVWYWFLWNTGRVEQLEVLRRQNRRNLYWKRERLEILNLNFMFIESWWEIFVQETLDIKFQINQVLKNSNQNCGKKLINDKACNEFLIKGCVSLTASTRIFPKTQWINFFILN